MKNDRIRPWAEYILLATLIVGAGFPAFAQAEPEFVAEETTGLVEALEFNRLEIVGIKGTLNIRAGLPGNLRFTARSLANRREERTLALWSQDRTLILTAGTGLEDERLLIEVIVPPNLATIVETSDSNVQATSLAGSFELHGTQLVFEGRALQGSASLDINGGTARIQGSQSEVSAKVRDVELTLSKLDGYTNIDIVGGSARFSEIVGDVAINSEGTTVSANVVDGRFELTANGGTANLSGLNQGAELRLEAMPIRLESILGSVEIETDNDVEFREVGADLRIQSYGGTIVGSTTRGQLNIRGADFTARIDQVGGAMSIEGDELKLALRDIRGDLDIQARASEISIEAAAGNVTVLNDYGNVTIKKAEKAVSVTSSQGDVEITELSGPIQLKADGPEVSVQWLGSARQEDSVISNESGNVTVMFAAKTGGRLDVTSREGQIESNLDGITVGDDRSTASGFINKLNKPQITVSAGGNIKLSSFEAPRTVDPAATAPPGVENGAKDPSGQ